MSSIFYQKNFSSLLSLHFLSFDLLLLFRRKKALKMKLEDTHVKFEDTEWDTKQARWKFCMCISRNGEKWFSELGSTMKLDKTWRHNLVLRELKKLWSIYIPLKKCCLICWCSYTLKTKENMFNQYIFLQLCSLKIWQKGVYGWLQRGEEDRVKLNCTFDSQ